MEADDATFQKKAVGGKADGADLVGGVEGDSGKTSRGQWCGLVDRGSPGSLALGRPPVPNAELRAPGPGPIRKVGWQPLATARLAGQLVALHTDSAKTYKAVETKVVLHDVVVRKKKKVFAQRKAVWPKPRYVGLAKHTLPSGRKLRVKSGTQVIDRAWGFLKKLVGPVCTSPGSPALVRKIRAAQFAHWSRGQSLWARTGVAFRARRDVGGEHVEKEQAQ